jgi:hypothetical protein
VFGRITQEVVEEGDILTIRWGRGYNPEDGSYGSVWEQKWRKGDPWWYKFEAKANKPISRDPGEEGYIIEKAHTIFPGSDDIAPATEISVVPSANVAGWHNQDMAITLTATDNEGGSGVKEIHYVLTGAVIGGQTVSGDTADVNIYSGGTSTLAYYAVDNNGNIESEHSVELKLDKTPPALTMPDLESTYTYNSPLILNFSASDFLSGLARSLAAFNGVSVASGDTVTLDHLGNNTFNLEAADDADNTAAQSSVFNVQYIFSGFLPPIQADGSKVYKYGSTLPVKFRLQDTNQAYVGTATATLTAQRFSDDIPVGDPAEVESTSGADTGNTFRYDADNEQYIFNLNTNSLSPGTWQLGVHLDDGTVRLGRIQLK